MINTIEIFKNSGLSQSTIKNLLSKDKILKQIFGDYIDLIKSEPEKFIKTLKDKYENVSSLKTYLSIPLSL